MKITNFNFQCDLSPVILWQYLNAEKLKALVLHQQNFMDVSVRDFMRDMNKNIFNISTADSDGLELWGKLLNIERPVYEKEGQVIEFDDEQYRKVLRAQISLLAFNGSAEALSHFFKMLFPDLPILIEDNLNMTVNITVLRDRDAISEWERVLLDYLLVPADSGDGEKYTISLPKPSGVKFILSYNKNYAGVFGFEGQTYLTDQGEDKSLEGFDNGVFFQ